MVNNPKALWDNCLSLIKDNVTEQQYKTWFAPIVFEKYDEEHQSVLVQVPSMYVYEYLEQYYVNLLSKVLTRCFGQKVQLNYRVVTDKQHRINTVVEGEEPTSVEPAPATNRANKAPTTLDVVERDLNPQLDIHKTFHNYIEGDSNKLPRTVGLSIAEHPGKSTFNPFFVFGPSGCGKTHLINAIGVRCKEMYHQKRVLYVSARLFQVQFTDASRKNTVNDFINFYQSIDVLIVDDVQEWATASSFPQAASTPSSAVVIWWRYSRLPMSPIVSTIMTAATRMVSHASYTPRRQQSPSTIQYMLTIRHIIRHERMKALYW